MIAARSAFATGARMAVKANGTKTVMERALWLPGGDVPAYLDGSKPGES